MAQEHLARIDYEGDPNIGLYCVATEELVIAPSKDIKGLELLSKNIVEAKVANTDLLGVFIAANSKGILLPNIMTASEKKKLADDIKRINPKIRIETINTKHTALGNLILSNDKKAIISPLLESHKDKIEKTLGVKAIISQIVNLNIVGAVCYATNKGFLLNMHAEKEDFEFVEATLEIDGDIGTVNFGSPFVHSGMIGNSRAVLVGKYTTGPEITRVDEALGFIEK